MSTAVAKEDVVDSSGIFLTQRELPRMTLVQTSFKAGDLVLRAPGMLALHVAVDRVEELITALMRQALTALHAAPIEHEAKDVLEELAQAATTRTG